MVGTDGDRTLKLMKARINFPWEGFLTEISCPWLATDCILFDFLKPDCLFLRERSSGAECRNMILLQFM